MELKQLIYFKRAAEYQHMTRAADSLGVAQPFLSKAISALEEELGVELFDHVGRNIRLNQNGECFYKRVSELLSGLEDACKEVQRLNAFAQNANISIGSNVALYIPGLLEYLRKRAPEIRITYSTANKTELIRMLEQQEVDFILCSPCLKETQMYESYLLMREECPIIYPPHHWLSRRTTVRLSELKDEPFVAVKKGYGMRDTSDQFFIDAGMPPPDYAIETADTRMIWELVKSGCGLAFTSFTTMIHDPVLRENYITPTEPQCQGTIGLSYLKNQRRRNIFHQFTAMTAEYFQNQKHAAWMGMHTPNREI